MNKIIVEDAKTVADAAINWSIFENRTVLIAGATGYVPQNFVHALLQRNDGYGSRIKVLALCRNKGRAQARFGEYMDRTDFHLILQDVREPVDYEGDIDFIIDAAGPAAQKDRGLYSEIFLANVDGCHNLLELARSKEAVLLFVSSVDVYGHLPEPIRSQESVSGSLDPLEPRNVYACAKRAAETLCLCYKEAGVDCRIARPVMILGGGVALDDGRMHIDLISQMLAKKKISLTGDGTPRRSFLYVTDAVTGMLTILAEGTAGEAYNLSWEENEASVLELAQLMSRLADAEIGVEYDLSHRQDPAVTKAVNQVVSDSAKLRKLGWQAKYSLREAVRRMMVYYRACRI